MTFSTDQEHSRPPIHFRPGPGQMGSGAAGEALKQKPQAQQPSQRPRRSAGSNHPVQSFHLPPKPDTPEPPSEDMSGAARIYMSYLNAKMLGRDMPFGTWATRHGITQMLGKTPYDVFNE